MEPVFTPEILEKEPFTSDAGFAGTAATGTTAPGRRRPWSAHRATPPEPVRRRPRR